MVLSSRLNIKVLFYSLFIFSALTGGGFYLMHPDIQIVRIFLPFLVFLIFFCEIKFTQKSYILLGYLIIDLLYQIVITIAFNEIELNIIVNHVFKFVLLITVLVLLNSQEKKFVKGLYWGFMIFLFVSSILALIEYKTHWHLPRSTIWKKLELRENFGYTYMPTGFFVNSNDFASVFSLISMYVASFHKTILKKRVNIYIILLFVVWVWLNYATRSIINMAVSIVFIIYYFRKHIIKRKLLYLIIAVIISIFLNSYYTKKKEDRINRLKNNPELLAKKRNEITTLDLRLNLYKYSFNSLKSNFGLGHGIYGSKKYYKELQRQDLFLKIIAPHSYWTERLINGGIWGIISFFIINLCLLLILLKKGTGIYILQLILYNVLLFSCSTYVFFLPFHLVFILYFFWNNFSEKLNLQIDEK